MSIILSYINKDYVAIVADKRETTKYEFLPMQHRDDIVKVHRNNDVIFALCGHSEYINNFMDEIPNYNTIREFKKYVAGKVNEIQRIRMENKEELARLKFDIHYGYIENGKPKLEAYLFRPNDPDILFADVPIDFQQAIVSWPDIDDPDSYEKEVADAYPTNILAVKKQAMDIVKRVSEESEYVSSTFDWEYLEV